MSDDLWRRIRDYYAEHRCALITATSSGGNTRISVFVRGELPAPPPFLEGEVEVIAHTPQKVKLW